MHLNELSAMTTVSPTSLPPAVFAMPPEGLIAKTKIDALDLEPVKFKLIKEKGWSLDKADAVEKLYKTYLLLFAILPGHEHVPTRDIDEMWHAHILDTQLYMEDCRKVFGYYLHHYPYLGLLGTEDARQAEDKFTATRRFFIALSGLDPADQQRASECGGSSCSSSSCSSSSCSSASCSSASCNGHGHGHSDTEMPSTPSTPPPIISSCTSSTPSRPLKDSWDKKDKDKDPANSNTPDKQTPRKPFWKRIIGFAGLLSDVTSANVGTHGEADIWLRSVSPHKMRARSRPTREDVMTMAAAETATTATRH